MTPRQALEALWRLLESETEDQVNWSTYRTFRSAREAHDALTEYLDDHAQPEEEDLEVES